MAVSIYLVKDQSKQKHYTYITPYHNTSKLKEIDINNIF